MEEQKKAAEALLNFISGSEDFKNLRSQDIEIVLHWTEAALMECFNQVPLQQAQEHLESLPKEEVLIRNEQFRKGLHKV